MDALRLARHLARLRRSGWNRSASPSTRTSCAAVQALMATEQARVTPSWLRIT